MPKRPSKKVVKKSETAKSGDSKAARQSNEQFRDLKTKSVLGQYQGRKSV